MINDYKNNYSVMMNLLGSHDTERLASAIINPDLLYDHGANARDTKSFDIRKPDKIEKMKQKLLVALQFTQPGAPLIYYGDEVGMWGGDDPDERKPMVWKEFKYEIETAHPYGYERVPDRVEVDKDLHSWYQLMASIRNANKELSLGDIKFVNLDEVKKILGYTRKLNGKKLFIVANNNPNSNSVSLNNFLNGSRSYIDLVTGKNVRLKGETDITLSPYQIMILK